MMIPRDKYHGVLRRKFQRETCKTLRPFVEFALILVFSDIVKHGI